MKTILLSLLVAVIFSSCSPLDQETYGYIQPEIRPYVESFVNEARIRGIEIDTDNLTICFCEVNEGAAGTAYHDLNKIAIDKKNPTWRKYPEELVFHEMAHLYLNREHVDEYTMVKTDAFGMIKAPASIMHHEVMTFYEKSYPELRQYYLDELFLNH